jgi:hypothetical protein
VAIDDIQWADSASTWAFSFAFRRLDRERVGVLVTERLPHHGVRGPAGSDRGRARSIADALAAGERFRRVEVGVFRLGRFIPPWRPLSGMTSPGRFCCASIRLGSGSPWGG